MLFEGKLILIWWEHGLDKDVIFLPKLNCFVHCLRNRQMHIQFYYILQIREVIKEGKSHFFLKHSACSRSEDIGNVSHGTFPPCILIDNTELVFRINRKRVNKWNKVHLWCNDMIEEWDIPAIFDVHPKALEKKYPKSMYLWCIKWVVVVISWGD